MSKTLELARTHNLAERTASKIANSWRAGKFREAGGVVKGMTPIIELALKEADRDWMRALTRRRRKGLL